MVHTKQNKALVVEVSASSMRICIPNRATPEEFSFGDFALRDMEVPNPAGLTNRLHTFLSEKKITGFDVVVIFHDSLCFELDLTGLPPAEQEIKYDRFIETVPMEAVMARRLIIGDKHVVAVAVNRNTYEFFKSSLSLGGLNVIAAVPAVAAKFLGYNQQLTEQSCSLLNKRIKQLMEFSFFNESNSVNAFAPSQRKIIGQHQIVFGTLSLVAIVVALVTSVYTLRKPIPKPRVIPVSAAEESATPSLEPIPTLPPTTTSELQVTLINQSGSSTALQTLRTALISTGFVHISLPTSATKSATTKIGFSNRVSEADKSYVLEQVHLLFTTLETVETPSLETDVYIITGTDIKTAP